MIPRTKKRKSAASGVFRSKSEARIAPPLIEAGATYESVRFSFPAKPKTYLPDFVLPNGIVIEVKGWFRGADRAKMKAVQAAHPALDIRMVLDTPHQWTTKAKTETNAGWCDRNGFPWAGKNVPESWIQEPANTLSLRAIESAGVLVKRARRA